MNQNQLIVAICIGIPLLSFLLAGLMIVFLRRAATVICPECGERFPQTDITEEGVSCPHCDWRLIAVKPVAHSREVPP